MQVAVCILQDFWEIKYPGSTQYVVQSGFLHSFNFVKKYTSFVSTLSSALDLVDAINNSSFLI